jgi:hypothetical protein
MDSSAAVTGQGGGGDAHKNSRAQTCTKKDNKKRGVTTQRARGSSVYLIFCQAMRFDCPSYGRAVDRACSA